MNREQRRATEKANAKKPIGERVADLEARIVAVDLALLAQVHSTLACRVLACAVAVEAGIPADQLIVRMRELAGTLKFPPTDEQLAEIEATLRHIAPSSGGA